ncbi:MAG: outer membrane protein transport protein [Rhodospirillales bacterium]|nr:outer membrane protein transport protein [Rhodospirillales bacterium]
MTSNFKFTLLSSVAAATVTIMAAGTANATNGYFSNGYGTASKGMAGVSVALPQDTQAAANNPAGMKSLGNRFDAGLSLFSPRRSYSTSGAAGTNFMNDNDQESSQEYFLVPSFGVNKDMGEYSLGVTATANGGMNTNYATNVFTGGTSGRTGIDLAQLLVGVTYARKLNENHTIGITPTVAAQRFKATGLQGFASISSDSTKLTDNGYDYSYGYGLRMGWLGEMSDTLTLGAMAQSTMYMQKFDKYAGLFANKGEFDIPPAVSIGASVKATDKLTVAADAQRIFYGTVDSISNSHNISVAPFHTGAGGTVNENSLGNSEGIGFGWQDMNVFKIGLQYAYSDALTLRTGASHNTAAFKKSETLFNILAPAVVDTHLSVGGTYDFAPNMSFSLAYTRAFAADITGVNINHIFGGTGTPIALKMDQHDLEMGFNYDF